MKKIKDICTVVLTGAVLLGLALTAWLRTPDTYSASERRTLTRAPKLEAKTLSSGRFMTDFEDYSMDQFPLRDSFRTLKAISSGYVFRQKDNHGIYTVNGYLSKLEYPLNPVRFDKSVSKLEEVYKKYIKDSNCKTYLSIIPDKNYFLAPMGGYLQLDYEDMLAAVKDRVPHDRYIEISDLLKLEDYYCTDQHWRQECIGPVAQRLAQAMVGDAANTTPTYTVNKLDYPFYGAYVGQSALPFDADTIYYLTSETMKACTVTSYATGKPGASDIYDMDKAYGRDPYEMFLAGSDPLVVIENPSAKTDKELVIFRDSFGSSVTPLLIEYYSKITLVDLRYLRSDLLGSFVEFEDQDVLFLYSTLIINNTLTM